MRISTEWLREWVDVPAPGELAELFEMAGIGVEAQQDDVFTLEITSNRGDWLSATGLAREIAAMTGTALRVPAVPDVSVPPESEDFPVAIENPDDCARYLACLVEGVRLGPSPQWMQQRLEECGMRPINNVVDVTNYVMLETGQPLHAFDADKLSGGRIEVRRARDGERIVTLDGIERTLDDSLLVIADAQEPVAVAGVMGGGDSEVSDETTRILLEVAHFAPGLVRRGARKLGFKTEASRRFERHVNVEGVRHAASRALQLLLECAGGHIVALTDRYVRLAEAKQVSLRPARCNALLGTELSGEKMASLLERLGFRIVSRDDDEIIVAAPSWRSDIEREVDLIEEVARLHGYNHIPLTLPRGANPSAGLSLSQRLEERAKDALLRCGLTEIMTMPLQSRAALERAGLGNYPFQAVELRNPLSEDFTQMRISLVPSLLEVLERNARRPARLFEIGKVYLARPGGVQPDERLRLGIALLDAPAPAHWQKAAQEVQSVDFFYLQSMVEQLLSALGTPLPQLRAAKEAPFHPGRCAALSLDGQDVGILGEVHPDIAERYDLGQRAYLAILDFDHVVRHVALGRQFAPISRFPSADRDLALVLPADVPAARVEEVLRGAGAALLESLRVFDVYTGPPIPEGSKSLALALRFRAERTLTDEEVESALTSMRSAAERELGAELRS